MTKKWFIIDKKLQVHKYYEYFYPEIEPCIDEKRKGLIMRLHQKEIEENFEENRKNGVNHHYICKLIRNDMLDDFIIFI